MLPVERLEDERNGGGSPSAENDGRDRHALRVFPSRVDDRALPAWRGETRVRVRRFATAVRRPVLALPVNQRRRQVRRHLLPPNIAVGRHRHVREDAVFIQREHRIGVGFHGRARRHPEEPGLGVDRVQSAVRAELHPCNVVADALGFPAGNRRIDHGQVGFATRAGKRRCDVNFFAGRIGQPEDQHVLGKPALVARHARRDAQGEAFLAEQGVAAIAAAVRPDRALFRKMDDVFVVGVAWPGDILFAG